MAAQSKRLHRDRQEQGEPTRWLRSAGEPDAPDDARVGVCRRATGRMTHTPP